MRRHENILSLVDFDFAHGLRGWSQERKTFIRVEMINGTLSSKKDQ